MKLFGLDNHFYHASVRRYVALFGSLFTDIHIKRVAGEREDIIQVPIKYGNGNMYMKVPQDDTRDAKKHSRVLPAMAFVLDNMYKDVHRKTNALNRIQSTAITKDGKKNFQLNRIPYNFVFELAIITKNTDDMLQIAEQIIPVFDSNLSVTIEDTTGVSVEQDIIISLTEIEMKDNYDDEMKNRLVEWKITFELRGFLYKRTQSNFVVKEVDIFEGFDLDNMTLVDVIVPNEEETLVQDNLTDASLLFESLPTTPIKKVTRKRRKE
jgi:hypothetical protein